eukprot:scaffold31574_cov124-Isochrysis_galbana.AAC.6
MAGGCGPAQVQVASSGIDRACLCVAAYPAGRTRAPSHEQAGIAAVAASARRAARTGSSSGYEGSCTAPSRAACRQNGKSRGWLAAAAAAARRALRSS